jgi:hypothetical protein
VERGERGNRRDVELPTKVRVAGDPRQDGVRAGPPPARIGLLTTS